MEIATPPSAARCPSALSLQVVEILLFERFFTKSSFDGENGSNPLYLSLLLFL